MYSPQNQQNQDQDQPSTSTIRFVYPTTNPQSTSQIRSRITVVCAECKRLKLRCDRRTPCGACTKRDTVARCIYASAGAEKIDLHSLHNRLIQVEATLSQLTTDVAVSPAFSSRPHVSGNVSGERVGPGIFTTLATFIGSFKICPPIRMRSLFLHLTPPPQLENFIGTLSHARFALELYYALFLLYIPFFYFSRAQPLLAEIKGITEEHQRTIHHPIQSDPNSNALPAADLTQRALDSVPPILPVPFPGHAWEIFRSSIISDWKLLIGVAAALLTALGSIIFQFAGVIMNPALRTAVFASIACTSVGAAYTIMLIIYFGAIPAVLRGRTAQIFIQAETRRYAWFNLWVLLALPSIWTAWSTITLMIFAMLFLWRTVYPTTEVPQADVRCSSKYITPIVVTGVLSVGGLYLILALRVLRSW